MGRGYQHPDLGLAASRALRNTFLLFINHPGCILLQQFKWTKTGNQREHHFKGRVVNCSESCEETQCNEDIVSDNIKGSDDLV